MLAKIMSTALEGIAGVPVTVEVDVGGGLPAYEIVGLAGVAVKESRERVRQAIKNSGYKLNAARVVVNLAPAGVRKEAPVYDLAIAVGQLIASGAVSGDTSGMFFLGELSLDGALRPVEGVLPMVIEMRRQGFSSVVLPVENAREASFVKNVTVYAAGSLREAAGFLDGSVKIGPYPPSNWKDCAEYGEYKVDFASIKGQDDAKRAAQIAAAGKHNILFIGPPGSGKTMLARATAGILPSLTFDEAMEVTKIHSIAGELARTNSGVVVSRPFRSPHHTASAVSLTGGGPKAKPGEISLAHNGVLFLDELPEFSKQTLEALRQPLEDGYICVSRAQSKVAYPAGFMLIAAMNPCPCGNFGSPSHRCTCTAAQIKNYVGRISGPFLSRVDMHIEMGDVAFGELTSADKGERSEAIRQRVEEARNRQRKRFAGEGIGQNADMTNSMVKKYCPLTAECSSLLEAASKTYGFSARTIMRLIKLSRTIADLDGEGDIAPGHIAEAVQYRVIDRKYWGYANES